VPRSFQCSLYLRSPNQNVVRITYLPMRATWPAHLINLHLIMLIIFGDVYKFLISSFYKFIQPPVTSSRLSINILFRSLLKKKLVSWSGRPSFIRVTLQVKLCYTQQMENKRLCTAW
jgi:hypothetical protein